jgi:peptidoglycan/LPS O-acetylase OafA/YrhL
MRSSVGWAAPTEHMRVVSAAARAISRRDIFGEIGAKMRIKRLDVLRCLAIILVLFRHSNLHGLFENVGWVGVDLFFVLSGFLISGLLFAEHKKRKRIDFLRFSIRRGLKIYPSFYFFLLVSYFIVSRFHQPPGLEYYLREIFYFQNYSSGVWSHTWSLAVEEHFYIFLPLLLLILHRLFPNQEDPFHYIPDVFASIAVACLVFRFVGVRGIPSGTLIEWSAANKVYAPTHMRMDSLFFGVLLGYLHHYRTEFLQRIFLPTRNRILIAMLAAALLSCCIVFPLTTRTMLTIGFTLLYVGFGLVLLLCLYVHNVLPTSLAAPLRLLGTVFASVGAYSYSIYLWHIAVSIWGPVVVVGYLQIRLGLITGFLSYFIGSIAIGIFMSRLVEYPVLRLRDRLFPATQTVHTRSTPMKDQDHRSRIFSGSNGWRKFFASIRVRLKEVSDSGGKVSTPD